MKPIATELNTEAMREFFSNTFGKQAMTTPQKEVDTQTDLKKYIPLDKVKTRANWGQLEFLLDDLLDLPEVKEFLTQQRNELINAFEEMAELLEQLTDEDDCSFDHHGYCQTHSWMYNDEKCPHHRSKELRSKLDEMRKQ